MKYLFFIIAMFIGEALIITTEIRGAVLAGLGHSVSSIVVRLVAVAMLGSAITVCAYAFGATKIKDLWVISAVSVASIVIVEPIALYLLTHQLPSKYALIGLLLAMSGLIVSLKA